MGQPRKSESSSGKQPYTVLKTSCIKNSAQIEKHIQTVKSLQGLNTEWYRSHILMKTLERLYPVRFMLWDSRKLKKMLENSQYTCTKTDTNRKTGCQTVKSLQNQTLRVNTLYLDKPASTLFVRFMLTGTVEN